MLINTRWTACLVVGVALVAVVVYVWFQDHGDSSDECSSPPSDVKRKSPKSSPRIQPEEKIENIQDTDHPRADKELPTEVKSKEESLPDDGVIKYDCKWTIGVLSYSSIGPLLAARNRLHGLGLIGVYKDCGIGYGNISCRARETGKGAFYITGTQTGDVEPNQMNEAHFSLVTRCDVPRNILFCEGPVRASSEGMTHGAVYALDDGIECVVHVHHKRLWTECMDRIPTTDRNVPYGTPEMAQEVERLYREDGRLKEQKVFVMGGHEDGLISFGSSMEEAMNIMINLYRGLDAVDTVDNVEMEGDGNGNGSESVGSENRSNGMDNGNGTGTTTEESTQSSTGDEHKMNINIIDDYATPILTSRNGNEPRASNRHNGFVEVDSDNLVL